MTLKPIQNILLFLLAVALSAVAGSAQELQITDATAAMEPMTVPMQRLDYNSQICALVKVVLPLPDVRFEGNIMGEPEFRTNEYLVYLTPGTKMLKIKAPGHYPVMADFIKLGLGPLESKTIYYLTVKSTATGQAPAQPAVTANYAILTVQPPTATVEIDGQQMQVEDGSVVTMLKLGQHTWQAKAAGYATDSGTFQVTAGEKTSISIQLRSQKATLKINTVADAAVYVNGQQRGTGNQTLELLPGIYGVELRRQGYRPYTQTVELQASQSATVSCTEFTPVYGVLNVNYRPVGATISLNGRQVGTTPDNLTNINVGTYTLAISAPGYTTHTEQITLTETAPVTLSGSLQKQTAATAPTTTPESTASGNYSTTPINLALCAELNGRTVYITQQQWKAMSPTQQAACKKKWLCVIGDYAGKTYRFLLALNDSGENRMTWAKAMSHYGDSLPTKEQAEVMTNNYKAINAAIIAFGGDKNPGWWYWTRTEKDSSSAWIVNMNGGYVSYNYKTRIYRVRAVAPVPSSAM